MNVFFLHTLAQVAQDQLDKVAPALTEEGSTGVTWLIAAALVGGILAIAFKGSRRTHMES